MDVIPWDDHAVIVELQTRNTEGQVPRAIFAEGKLAIVLAALQRGRGRNVVNFKVSFPDRGCRPYEYNGQQLAGLMTHPSRPDTGPIPAQRR